MTAGKRSSWFSRTYPIHEAVKQGDAYITSKLLMFGADPGLKDMWGRSAYDYALRGSPELAQIMARNGRVPLELHCNRWKVCPPPVGYEEFFADLEKDNLVQVASHETEWFNLLGRRHLRKTSSESGVRV
eukprot:s53_g9.t1